MGGRGSAFIGSNSSSAKKLPELNGSEKQIKWANDIRESVINTIDANIKTNKDILRKNKNDFDAQITKDLYEGAREAYLLKFKSVKNAKEIIDGRNFMYNPYKITDLVRDRVNDMKLQKANGWIYDKKKKKMVKK